MAEREFRGERLARLAEMEERQHFWLKGRRALLERMLASAPGRRDSILDLGCGTGSLLAELAHANATVTGIDLRMEGLRAARTRSALVQVVQGDATSLPIASESIDLVLALDLLEHLDDAAALREIARVLRPGGALLLSVPAAPWLWSFRDEDAGHLRRYTRAQLHTAVRDARLRIADVRFYQCLLFPVLAIARLAGRRGSRVRDAEDRPAPMLNRVLTTVSLIEVRFGRWIAWPFGSSLAALCTKG